MNVEILYINEEYITTTIFTLLASAHGTIFPKPMEEMSKEELSVFLFKSLRRKDGTSSMESI